jgi:dTDP-4-dehydrorhamnose 3,5-epimerase
MFDMAVGHRRSPPFLQSGGRILLADNERKTSTPEAFAHGFMVTSEGADNGYKATG